MFTQEFWIENLCSHSKMPLVTIALDATIQTKEKSIDHVEEDDVNCHF